MATTPIPTEPVAEENPWADLKPKDIFTDPGFHKLSKEARRVIASKVWSDFGKSPKADQDATLDAPIAYWNEYFKPAPPPPEPTFMEKVGKVAKGVFQKIGEGSVNQAEGNQAEGAQVATQLKGAGAKALPSDLGIPPPIEDLVDQQRQQQQWAKKYKKSRPAGEGQQKSLAQLEAERNTVLEPAHLPTSGYRGQGQLGLLSTQLQTADSQIRQQGKDLKVLHDTIDRTDSKQVDDFNAKLTAYNNLVGDARSKATEIQNLLEAGANAGVPGLRPGNMGTPEQQALMGHLKNPDGSIMRAPETESERQQMASQLSDFENLGETPLAIKYLSAVGQTVSGIPTFNIMPYQPEGVPGENLIRLLGAAAGAYMTGGFLGGGMGMASRLAEPIASEFATPEAYEAAVNVFKGSQAASAANQIGRIGQIPYVAKWAGILKAVPIAGAAVKGALKLDPEVAEATLSQLAGRSEPFSKALDLVLRHPATAVTIAKALPGIEGALIMSTQRAIHDIGTGEDLKDGVSDSLRFAVLGEMLRYAPGISNLAGVFKLDVDNPEISHMFDRMAIVGNPEEKTQIGREAMIKTAERMGFKASAEEPGIDVPPEIRQQWLRQTESEVRNEWKPKSQDVFWSAASNQFREIARQRHPEYEQMKNMIRDYANSSSKTSIGTALQSATAYGLAAAGNTFVTTKGDLQDKLSNAGEQGLITFLQIAGFHTPSIIHALQLRAGRPLDPGDAFSEWANTSGDERKKIVAGITPDEWTQAETRSEEMSGRAAQRTPLLPSGEVPAGGLDKPIEPVIPPGPSGEAGLPPRIETEESRKPTYSVATEQIGNNVLDSWLLKVPGGSMDVTFGDNSVRVDGVRVDKEMQGNGRATALYRKLGEMMKQRGIPGSAIEGDVEGDPAIIAKLKSHAAEVAGAGTEGIGRYEIPAEEGGLPQELTAAPEMPGAPQLPAEMPPEPFPEAPPVPEGPNPFEWRSRLPMQANGAPPDLTDEFVMTPKGMGIVQEEDDTNPGPEGTIPVRIGKGETEHFNERDIVLLNKDDVGDNGTKYAFPKMSVGLKINPNSQFKGMAPTQVYHQLRDQQVGKLLAYKKAEYAQETGLPGWRPFNLQYLRGQYEGGYKDVSNVFGADEGEEMRRAIEPVINRALGIQQPPHAYEEAPQGTEYLGPNRTDGEHISYAYRDHDLLAKGASEDDARVSVKPGESLRTAIEENRKQFDRTQAAKKKTEADLKPKTTKIGEEEPPHIKEGLPPGIKYNGVQEDAEGKSLFMYTDVADTGTTFTAEPGESLADTAARKIADFKKIQAQYDAENAPPQKLTGALSQFFESDALIDPKIFPVLNSGLNSAEQAGIADDIFLGLIEGKSRIEIANDIMTGHAPGTVPNLAGLKRLVSVIQQLKKIPDSTSPDFPQWQEKGFAILKDWSKPASSDAGVLPPELAPEPPPPQPDKSPTEPLTERPRLEMIDGMIRTISGRNIPAPPAIRLGSNRQTTMDVKRVDAWLLDQGRQEAEARNDDFVKTQFDALSANSLHQVDKDSLNQYLFGHENPEIIPEKTAAAPPTKEKARRISTSDDDGKSFFGFGVEKITGKLQLALSVAQKKALMESIPFARAKFILDNRVQRADQLGTGYEAELASIRDQFLEKYKKLAEPKAELPKELPEEPTILAVMTDGNPIIEATQIPESDALAKLHERLRTKTGARSRMEMALPEEGAAPTREQMLNDPEILDIIGGIGEEYYKAGVTDRAQWHASLYADLDGITEGLGEDLESLFGLIWNSITDEKDYIGGTGGIYGFQTPQGDAGSAPGSLPVNAGQAGEPHVGVQSGPVEGFGGLGEAPGIPGGEILPGAAGVPGGPEEGLQPAAGGGTGEQGSVSGGGGSPRESGRFFEYAPYVEFGKGGWAGKLENNIDAVRLVVELNQSGRLPTESEKIIMARFVGWGALWRPLDPANYQYAEQRRELRNLLTEDEFRRAQASTQNAFYTAEPLARTLWKIADRLGFKGGGTVMEGAIGNGIFLGTAPDHIANTSQFFGTELDPITAHIAQYLYPAAKIFNRGFQDLEFPDNTVDFAISNVPFNVNVFDKRYAGLFPGKADRIPIHDYYFLKTMDKLRPGGIMVYITSTYTLDKKADTIRRMLADRGDLVSAFRLPNKTFLNNAGTAVATDVITLRKRMPGEISNGIDWSKSVVHKVPDLVHGGENSISTNEYFMTHPENILGSLAYGHGLHEGPVVIPPAGVRDEHLDLTQWVSDEIGRRLDSIEPGLYQPPIEDDSRENIRFLDRFSDANVWEKQIVIGEDGNLLRKVNGSLQALEGELANVPDAVKTIKDLIGLRESLWNLFRIQLESNDDDLLKEAQSDLEKTYDKYVSDWGRLNNKRVKALFGADPTYYFLISLEEENQDDGSISKAPIFHERSMRPAMPLDSLPDDPRQALLMTYASRGFLDIDLMARLTGKTPEYWQKTLSDQNLIFKDPVTGALELAEGYLSGDIYDKIEEVEKALEMDPSYQRNLDALKEAIPAFVPINDPTGKSSFDVRLGASWIKDDVIVAFIQKILENDYVDVNLDRTKGGAYRIKTKGHVSNYILYKQWGTEHKSALTLIELALNQKRPAVYIGDGEDRHRDPKLTMEAQIVQAKIKAEFTKWAKTCPFAQQMESDYNSHFSRIRLRQYDGSHLTFEGMNASALRHGTLEPHQANAVWRTILDGRVFIAHFAGSGKTFIMAAAAMELRRMGLAKKNMISVPKDVYRQVGADFAKLYPGAKLLVVDEADFIAKNRKKLFARIAMEDWDAVIISHDQLGMIPVSPERMSRVISEEIDSLEESIREIGKPGNKTEAVNLKRMQKRLDDYRAKLDSLLNIRRDDTIYFDQMGVDYLFVDEAHRFKGLPIQTSMGNIAGLGQQASKRSLNLKAKTDFLLEKYNGRGVIFASGTPVSNSMAELYNFNKYLDPNGLRNAGVRPFDSWAANFGNVIMTWGIGPDGKTYRPQQVFGEYVNLPELQTMFRRYADVVMPEDIDLPIPELLNGQPTVVKVQLDAAGEDYFDEIRRRLEVLDKNPDFDKTIDNILKVNSDARKASIDMRLVSATAPDNPNNKSNTAVRRLAEYYFEHQDTHRTQLVFCDLFRNKETGFNLFEDMKKKLTEDHGIPPEQIAIIHDYQKVQMPQLYKDMREGKIRILLTTKRTAEGANIQTRLGKLYHLDGPWTPKDLEQRERRMVRQGNTHSLWNEPVEIVQFVTEKSLDSRVFEILRRKAKFTRQYLKGDSDVRKASDPAAKVVVNFEMISAEASGNPEYQVKIQLEQKMAELEVLQERWFDNQRSMVGDLEKAKNRIAGYQRDVAYLESANDDFQKNREPFRFNLDGQDFIDTDTAVETIRKKKETGVPNPKIAEGKELAPGEPEIVPYRPYFSGKHGTPEDAIAKINYLSDPANRDFAFNATIAGKKYAKQADAVTALAEMAKPYLDVIGKTTLQFDVYGFPITLDLHHEKRSHQEGGKVIVNDIRWMTTSFLHESKTPDAIESAIPQIVHALHDIKRRIKSATDLMAAQVEESNKIQDAIGKPFEDQGDLDETRYNLDQVNQRLGIATIDEEGGATDEDTGGIDPDTIDQSGDSEEEQEEDEEDAANPLSDAYYDLAQPYRELGVPGVAPSDITAPETARIPGETVRNLPELPKEAEAGPEFLFSQPVDQGLIDALNAGQVPADFIDALKTRGDRRLASIQRVSTIVPDERWEVSDGITLLQIAVTSNGMEVYDALGYGRMEIPELLWLIEQVTGKPAGLTMRLRTALGHIVPDGAGGHVEIRPDLFYQLKDREQLARTLAHEIGHAVDYSPDNDFQRGNLVGRLLVLHHYLKQTHPDLGPEIKNRALRDELIALSDHWRPWDPKETPEWYRKYRRRPDELYADFLSAILNSPGTVDRFAPKMYKLWHQELNRKPEVKTAYFQLREMMHGTPEELIQHRLDRFAIMFNDSELIELAIQEEENTRSYNWWRDLRAMYDDQRWELNQRMRKSLREGVYAPVEDNNALFLWDEMPNKLRNELFRHAERIKNQVMDPLKAAGLSKSDFDTYTALHRAATERANIANPIVGTGEAAQETLEGFKSRLGPDKLEALESAVRAFHDVTWPLVEAATKSGIFSQELMDKVLLPNKYNYVKFTGQEYISTWVSAHVQRQVGFVGKIASTLIESMKLAQSMIYLTARNSAVKASLDYMKEFFPEEIKPAVRTNAGRKERPAYESPPRGYDLVEVMNEGKSVGYYVDRYIAESLNHVSAERVQGLTKLAQWFQHKYFWKVTILYNLGFAAWAHPGRLGFTNFRKLPLRGLIVGDLFQLLGGYARATPHVWRWMQNRESVKGWGWLKSLPGFSGSNDDLINEMIDSNSYSMPMSDLMEDEADSFAYQLKRAGLYNDIGMVKKSAILRNIYNAMKFVSAPVRFLMQAWDMDSKVAGYIIRKDAGESGKDLAFKMRNFTATPNFNVKGKKSSSSNSWLPFSTIMKESWKSEYLCATDPKMRSGYWFRTMKVVFLKVLTILAEIGALDAIFGPELKKKYDSIPRYYKNHYICIPVSEPDKDGKVAFIPLPMDAMTREMGGILRHSLIIEQHRDPQGWSHFMQFLQAELLPSLTPGATIPLTWIDFLAGGPVKDKFRQTPIMSDAVRKADDYRAKMKMVYWTINELGLGQFATYDDSTKSGYEMFTELPGLGALAGRIVKVSNYGTVEQEKGSLYEKEMFQERMNLDRRNLTPAIERFYNEGYSVSRHHLLIENGMQKGEDYKQLIAKYPDAIWSKLFSTTSQALVKLMREKERIEKDKSLDEKERRLKSILIIDKMNKLAVNALTESGKMKTEELPSEFTSPPEIK